MPTYDYIITQDGRRQRGTLTATSEKEAVGRLRVGGAAVLSMRENASRQTAGDRRRGRAVLARLLVSAGEVELSLRQLASILGADVPILVGLDTVSGQASSTLRASYSRVRERVREGCALSVALREESPFLDRVSLGLVQVGEANGTLDAMLEYAADLMERARRLRNDLVQAFSYPCFVVVVALGVAWFMATKVIPKILAFIQARQGKGGGLPPVTQALLEVTAFFQSYGLLVLAVPLLLVFAILLARQQAATGERVDRWLLRVPLLGGAFRAHANSMWCRTLGALLASGVGIVEALELVEQTMGNWFVAAQFRIMRQHVREGQSVTHALDRTALPQLCPMARAMIAVSEQSGGLDTSLAQVADHYEDVLQRRVKLLSRLVEPAMYAIVGGMVGFVYFAFFMAMMAAQRSNF